MRPWRRFPPLDIALLLGAAVLKANTGWSDETFNPRFACRRSARNRRLISCQSQESIRPFLSRSCRSQRQFRRAGVDLGSSPLAPLGRRFPPARRRTYLCTAIVLACTRIKLGDTDPCDRRQCRLRDRCGYWRRGLEAVARQVRGPVVAAVRQYRPARSHGHARHR